MFTVISCEGGGEFFFNVTVKILINLTISLLRASVDL